MPGLPPYNPGKIEEGHYHFKIAGEHELLKRTRRDGSVYYLIKIAFLVFDDYGNSRRHKESFFDNDERYKALLQCVDVDAEKGARNASLSGQSFEADIKHVKDKENPDKTWARITNIVVPDDRKSSQDVEEDDVPPPPKTHTEESPPPVNSPDDIPF